MPEPINNMGRDARKTLSKAKLAVERLLKIRLRSEKEIKDKLKQKNFSTDVIDATIQYFKKLDLVNDRQFAQKWIESRLLKPFGINRIRFELRTKGVDEVIIQKQLEDALDDFPEEDVVSSLAQRRATLYKGIDKAKIKQRLYGYLVRKGFQSTAIFKALKKI